jgi:hypothetical protein
MQIHQLRFIHVLLYLSRKKGIRAIHLKEALFNIATKTMIFVEKNVITCNIAVTKQSSKLDFRIYWPENFKIRIFI